MPNRVYAQYRDKPKALAWFAITETLANDLGAAAEAVRKSWDLDTNIGEQLDVIGRIVVVQRPLSLVGDIETYRALLRSKIAKNNSDATYDGIVSAMNFIIPNSNVSVSDFQDMSFDIIFAEELSPAVINLLNEFDLVPKPQGVRFKGFAVIPMSTIYGADDAQYGADDAQYGFYFGGAD